jgi:hypothetical protein
MLFDLKQTGPFVGPTQGNWIQDRCGTGMPNMNFRTGKGFTRDKGAEGVSFTSEFHVLCIQVCFKDIAPSPSAKDQLLAIKSGVDLKLSTRPVGWEEFCFRGIRCQTDALLNGHVPYGATIAYAVKSKHGLHELDGFPVPNNLAELLPKMFDDFVGNLIILARSGDPWRARQNSLKVESLGPTLGIGEPRDLSRGPGDRSQGFGDRTWGPENGPVKSRGLAPGHPGTSPKAYGSKAHG